MKRYTERFATAIANPVTGEWEREYESGESEGGTYTVFGLNFGGGAEYRLTERIRVNAELRYETKQQIISI
jgi:opacity protein-like surface antigen